MNQDQHDTLHEVLRGNIAAIELCKLFAVICQTWDDLIDNPHTVTSAEVSEAAE